MCSIEAHVGRGSGSGKNQGAIFLVVSSHPLSFLAFWYLVVGFPFHLKVSHFERGIRIGQPSFGGSIS